MGIYVPLPENTDEVKYVVPPRSNFERRQPWIGRIKHAVMNTPSMRLASMLVGCDFKTFRKWAKLYGFWCPNQSGQGISKKRKRNQDICPLCNS